MSNRNNAVTCYFLDVGQGTSQVIILNGHRAIIIDTGRKCKDTSPLLTLLRNSNIQTIEALILSHNGSDHIGDVENILDQYLDKIRRVFILFDRPLKENKTYNIMKASIGNDIKFDEIVVRLEAKENTGDIFVDIEHNLSISVLYPYVRNNVESEKNGTCAVIALLVGDQKIIFSGDAPVEAWRTIISHNGKQSLQILTIPHHGGNFTINEKDHQWFFENVTTRYAVVSVGYNNKYNHPQPDIIRSFVQHGAEILCTQSNPICNFETSDNDVTCCGTVVADIDSQCTTIRDIIKLQEIKNKFPNCLCKNESAGNF
ncbi:MAG: MBL fold metallo-hydrolase [Planctomycetaceae bacterium]|jgi:competence protein ComEC|nr:MBL fold metallo-hydrolase [Planctomycetaceae bacterium]